MFTNDEPRQPAATIPSEEDRLNLDHQAAVPENWETKVLRDGSNNYIVPVVPKSPDDPSVKSVVRRLEICEATDLTAHEAAALVKTDDSRNILHLNSSDGQIIELRRNPRTLLDENRFAVCCCYR